MYDDINVEDVVDYFERQERGFLARLERQLAELEDGPEDEEEQDEAA